MLLVFRVQNELILSWCGASPSFTVLTDVYIKFYLFDLPGHRVAPDGPLLLSKLPGGDNNLH